MKIVFYPGDCFTFHGKTIEERPLGGIETGVVRLAEALQKFGHEVIVLTAAKNPPDTIPKYLTESRKNEIGPFDVLIAVRKWQSVFSGELDYKKCFLWTGDCFNTIPTLGIGDLRVSQHLNGLLGVSQWQLKLLCQSSGFPIIKTWIIRNGINLDDFNTPEVRKRKRLIFTAQPDRGLIFFPKIFKILKKKHPELELHIFSSYDRFSENWNSNYEPLQDIDYLSKVVLKNPHHDLIPAMQELMQTSDVYLHGSIPQKQLIKEFLKSSIFAYPCKFHETSCISALEAMAAGCAIITTDIGALKETVGSAGILIPVNSTFEEAIENYISELDKLLTDDDLLQSLVNKGKERVKNFTWKRSAQYLLDYLKIFHKLE